MSARASFRRVALVVAAWYLVAASSLLDGALDLLAPLTKTVASLDFPCAEHVCGCASAGECFDHCCCFPDGAPARTPRPKERTPVSNSRTISVSRIVAAKCAGDAPAGLAGRVSTLKPHVPVVLTRVAVIEERAPAPRTPFESGCETPGHRSLPEKVPIRIA